MTNNTDNMVEGRDYEIVEPDLEFKLHIWAARCSGLLGTRAYNKILTIAENAITKSTLNDLKELSLFIEALYLVALREEHIFITEIGFENEEN